MNNSGESAAAFVNFYKIPLSDIIVISDDIDMNFGKVRIRDNGSSGGQNGLKSIAMYFGTSDFSRLKIGIGRDDRYDVSEWVLSRFMDEELKNLREAIFPEVRLGLEKWLEIRSS